MKPSSSTSEDKELASFCSPARDPTLTGGLQACHLESGGDGGSRVSRTACASNCRWAMNRLTASQSPSPLFGWPGANSGGGGGTVSTSSHLAAILLESGKIRIQKCRQS